MATKSAPTKKVTAPAAKRTGAGSVTEKAAEKPVFSWDALPEAEAVEYTRGAVNSRVDVEADTPEVIKLRVKESYAKYQAAIEKADGSYFDKERKLWVSEKQGELSQARMAAGSRQRTASEAQALEFLRLAKRYGAGSGMTVRGDVDPKDKTVAVFYAKPKETRVRS